MGDDVGSKAECFYNIVGNIEVDPFSAWVFKWIAVKCRMNLQYDCFSNFFVYIFDDLSGEGLWRCKFKVFSRPHELVLKARNFNTF